MLQHPRVPRESTFLLGYVLFTVTLCLLISLNNTTDRILLLLSCPIIFAALWYQRWMYLLLLVIGTGATFVARNYISAEQSVALRDMVLMLVVMIVVVETIHWLADNWARSRQLFLSSKARYQLLVDQSPTSLYQLDLDGNIIECNQALARLLGYDACEQVVGRNAAIFYPSAQDCERCVDEVLQHGQVVEAEVRMRRQDGTFVWVLKHATRVDDAAGRPTGIVGTLIDITQRKHTDELQCFLAQAIALLNSSRDDRQMFRAIADLATSSFADWCTIVLCDSNDTPQRVALACGDPNKRWIADALHAYPVRTNATHMFPRVMQTGVAEFLPELPADYFASAAINSQHLTLLEQIGARSAITVPFSARGRVLGSMTLTLAETERRYDLDDLHAAQELARYVTQTLEMMQLHNKLQRRLSELITVEQIARMINSSLELTVVFEKVVSQIRSAFGYRMVSSYLLQDGMLHLQAHTGYETVLQTIPISQGVSGRVIRSGQAVFTQDADREPDFLFAVADVKQAIIVPLKREERVLGILSVETNGEPVLTDEDFTLVKLLAEQISIAVFNAHLFKDLQASEQRYRASEERYRLLADHSLDLIGLLDLQSHILYASPSHKHVLGYTADELLHANVLAAVHDDDKPVLREVVQQLQIQGGSRIIELRLWHKQGKWIVVEALVSAIIDSANTPQLLFSAREITERKRAEEASRQLERKMLEAQKLESLGVLAGGIAHDFNNLLAAILGYMELARLESEPQTAAYQAIQDSLQVLQRASDLTRQLLAYAGRGQAIVAPVNINSIIHEMTRLFSPSIMKTANLSYELASQPLLVHADATQLRQVLMNLVINAAEALPNGEGTITIRTGTREIPPEHLPAMLLEAPQPLSQFLYVEVADTGHGMDLKTRTKIFEPFFTTKATGRGLGLAAVLGIVRGHGGTLNVESTLGRGTTFTILLPMLQE